jgi:hypothetical protein
LAEKEPFVGGLRSKSEQRLRFYRPYLVGVPTLAAAVTLIAVARSPWRDRDLRWQFFVLAGIANPAWLLLLLRRLRCRLRH